MSGIIELVTTTNKPDKVLQSLAKEKLEVMEGKIDNLKNLMPEKIQFVFTDNDMGVQLFTFKRWLNNWNHKGFQQKKSTAQLNIASSARK